MNLKRSSYITLVLVIGLLLSLSWFSTFLFKKTVIKYYKAMIENMSQVKTIQYYSIFKRQFSQSELTKEKLTYLSEYLNKESSLESIGFVNLYIVDMKGKTVFDYKSFKDVDPEEKIDNILTLTGLDKKIYDVEITSLDIDINGERTLVLNIPYVDNIGDTGVHPLNFIFLFSYDLILNDINHVAMINISIMFAIALFILVLYIFFSKYYKNHILFLNKFIKNEIFDNRKLELKLTYDQPFEPLEKTISYLIAQQFDYGKKHADLLEKLDFLTMYSQDGYVIENAEGLILESNKRMANMLGFEREKDLTGKYLKDFLADTKNLKKFEIEAKRKDMIYTIKLEFVNTKEQKNSYDVTTCHRLDENGLFNGYLRIIHSDLESIAGNVSLSPEIMNRVTVLDQIQEAYVLLKNNIVMDVNQAFCHLFNMTKSEVHTSNILTKFKKYEFVYNLKHTSNKKRYDFMVFEPTLNKWLQVHNSPILIESGTLNVLMISDVSSQRLENKYPNFILEEFLGFFFITTKDHEVLYVSKSFMNITDLDFVWFNNYFKKQMEKNQNILGNELSVIKDDSQYNFSVFKAEINITDTKMYICLLNQTNE